MKRILPILGVLALVFGLVILFSRNDTRTTPVLPEEAQPEGPVVATIRMNINDYQPNELSIKVGEAIQFVNASDKQLWPASNIHPTHDIYPEFDPQRALQPGESWTFTFRRSGLWRMHDHLLPYLKGVITVN
jgi:plastocyanin